MKRVAALLLSVLAAAAALAAPAPAAAPAPVAVGIAAREFSLSLYRPSVRPGVVRFNLTNFGEDVHDLAVIAPDGRRLGHMPEVSSAGGRGRLELRLRRRGSYRLVCTVAGHAREGMQVKLRVR